MTSHIKDNKRNIQEEISFIKPCKIPERYYTIQFVSTATSPPVPGTGLPWTLDGRGFTVHCGFLRHSIKVRQLKMECGFITARTPDDHFKNISFGTDWVREASKGEKHYTWGIWRPNLNSDFVLLKFT